MTQPGFPCTNWVILLPVIRMKTFPQPTRVLVPLLLATALSFVPGRGHAQFLYIGGQTSGDVGKFDVITGKNASGFPRPQANYAAGLLVLGNTLYVSNFFDNRVSTYRADTGAVINSNFITGVRGASALTLAGNTLYVGAANDGTVGTYNASTGAAINASLISGVLTVSSLLVSGSDLFLGRTQNTTVRDTMPPLAR